jgi:hypothetical protein
MNSSAFMGQCAPNDANIVLVDGTACQRHTTLRWVAPYYGGRYHHEKSTCFFCHSCADHHIIVALLVLVLWVVVISSSSSSWSTTGSLGNTNDLASRAIIHVLRMLNRSARERSLLLLPPALYLFAE